MKAIRQAERLRRCSIPRSVHRPVIPLLACLMAGILTGDRWAGHSMAAGAAAAASLLLVFRCLSRGLRNCSAPLALFLAAGYLSIQPWTAPRLPPQHVSRFAGPVRWTITGAVDDTPVATPRRTRMTLAAESIEASGRILPVTGRLRLSVAGHTPELTYGRRIRFVSRIRVPRNFNNPGGFDYRRHLALTGIRATAFSDISGITVLDGGSAGIARRWLDRLRCRIAGLIDTGEGAADARGLLKALILGDRSAVSPSLRTVFNRTGVSHLLAISGLHMGIVAAAAFRLLTLSLSFLPSLLWQASVRKWSAALTLMPVAAYGWLAGFPPSTQRAALMVAVFLIAVWIGRRPEPFNTLAVAALSILAVHPPALFSASFQLSFTAVATIMAAFTWRPDGQETPRGLARALVRKSLAFLSVSGLALLGTLPLSMYYFNQVSLVGLVGNSIAVPIIGACVVPAGLASALVGSLWSPAGIWGFAFCRRLLEICLPILNRLSAFELAAVKTITPSALEIVLYYLLLGAVLHLVRSRRAAPWSLPSRQAAWVLLLVSTVVLAADAVYWSAVRFGHRDLRVTIIDVGQGSAAAVEFPDGSTMLIDGGGFPDPTVFDIGARVVAPFLWRKKILTVDTLVLSHPDADHLNGLVYIAENFHVKRLWSTGDAADSRSYRRLMEVVRQKGIEHLEFRDLPRTLNVAGVKVEILYPNAEFSAPHRPTAPETRNNRSMVLRLVVGGHAILLPGDLMATGEAELVALHGQRLRSSVLIAPHHGSRSSSSATLLETVRPETVIVSAASGRAYHPHPEVLKRYQAAGAEVLCTATAGAVGLSLTETRTRVTPFLDPSKGPSAP